jgi:hypothetical protein
MSLQTDIDERSQGFSRIVGLPHQLKPQLRKLVRFVGVRQ